MSPADERRGAPLLPGATLGVMGGGQLARMFVHAAQAMGYRTAVLDPDPASPAGLVSHHHIRTDYLDPTGRWAARLRSGRWRPRATRWRCARTGPTRKPTSAAPVCRVHPTP